MPYIPQLIYKVYFRCTGFLNGEYGRVQESYLEDLGISGNQSKLGNTENEV